MFAKLTEIRTVTSSKDTIEMASAQTTVRRPTNALRTDRWMAEQHDLDRVTRNRQSSTYIKLVYPLYLYGAPTQFCYTRLECFGC